jgi:hypothetical protein
VNERLYWTDVDDAEQRLLCFYFAKAHYAHREACGICRYGGAYCDVLREAFDVILDWREGRILSRKAEWLRAREAAR